MTPQQHPCDQGPPAFDFREGKLSRHWIMPGITLDSTGASLGVTQTWGEEFLVVTGSSLSFVLARVRGDGSSLTFPRAIRIDEVEVTVFDAGLPISVNISGSWPSFDVPGWSGVITQVNLLSAAGSLNFPAGVGAGVAVASSNSTVSLTAAVPSLSSTGTVSSSLWTDSTSDALYTTLTSSAISRVTATTANSQVAASVPITGTATTPNYIFAGLAAFSTSFTANFGGSTFTINMGGITINPDVPSIDWSINPAGGQSEVALSLYVATRTPSGADLYRVRDILNNLGDVPLDYLDYVVDYYDVPSGVFGFTSRSWRVKLPFPIIIGPEQALVLTVSAGADNSSNLLCVPYLRARITEWS